MIQKEDIDALDEDTEPWSDTEPKWSHELIERMGDELGDVDTESMTESLQKDAWLEQQDVATTLLVGCEHVLAVDRDTRTADGVHVYTAFTATPSEIGMADGLDAIIGYHTVRHRIDSDTDYRITNTRLAEYEPLDADVLVLTLRRHRSRDGSPSRRRETDSERPTSHSTTSQ